MPEPLDLEPIKARVDSVLYPGFGVMGEIHGDTIALITEVERLREDAWRQRLRDERPPIAT